MKKVDDLKVIVTNKLNLMFLEVIKFSLSMKVSYERIEKLKYKYRGLPKDELANVLINRAVRKNTIHGSVNGAFITGTEAVALLPIPEVASKAVAVSATAGAIVEDATYSTRTQMQLILDLSEIYECPYDLEDEDDIWLIFKAAMGIKGNEKVAKYAGIIFYETAKKQFRKLLRTGIRSALQNYVVKVAGKQIGKLLAEKYVMKLIPVATIILSGTINNVTTKYVGKWAKTKVKIRSALFNNIDKIKCEDLKNKRLVLPTIYYIGTCDDKLTDNTLMLYCNAEKRLSLLDDDIKFVKDMIDNDDFEDSYFNKISEVESIEVKKILKQIALTTAAVNFDITTNQHISLQKLSDDLGLEYCKEEIQDKIKYFTN